VSFAAQGHGEGRQAALGAFGSFLIGSATVSSRIRKHPFPLALDRPQQRRFEALRLECYIALILS
jgi:hypothetical protein